MIISVHEPLPLGLKLGSIACYTGKGKHRHEAERVESVNLETREVTYVTRELDESRMYLKRVTMKPSHFEIWDTEGGLPFLAVAWYPTTDVFTTDVRNYDTTPANQ